MMLLNAPVQIGERIIVNGIMYAQAHVSDVVWSEEESRWVISLDWGEFGKSRVYGYDEDKVWYRWAQAS